MIGPVLFIVITCFGVFASLCVSAPVWDEDRQMPAEDVPATAERA